MKHKTKDLDEFNKSNTVQQNPVEVKSDDCYSAYRVKHLPAWAQRFCFLYRSKHLTDQHFRRKLLTIAKCKFETFDDFHALIRKYFPVRSLFGINSIPDKWIMDNWKHFNPATQHKIVFVYKNNRKVI